MKNQVFLYFMLFALIACDQSSCNSGVEIANRLRDDDDDKWFNDTVNHRTDLHITRVTFIAGGGIFQPVLKIAVDGALIAHDSLPLDPDFPASTRCVGTWALSEADAHQYTSTVRVSTGDIFNAEEHVVRWTNVDSTFTLGLGSYTVEFETRYSRFADPSPNADSDCDIDGILDSEESRLAGRSRNVGSPLQPDIVMAVGYTHPDWKLTDKSQFLLTSAFNQRGINLYVATEPSDIPGISAGQVRLGDEAPERSLVMDMTTATAIRLSQVNELHQPYTRFVVLAEDIMCVGVDAYGCALNLDLIMQSHLPVLGPDHFEYQGKVLMHELGHSLGLCHPTVECPSTGTLPLAEQNPAITAMGTPAEEDNPISFMLNALSRPLNFTPTQWQNIDVRRATGRSQDCP